MLNQSVIKPFYWVILCVITFLTGQLQALCTAGNTNTSNFVIEETPTSMFASPINESIPLGNETTALHKLTGLIWDRCTLGKVWDGVSACSGSSTDLTWRNALLEVVNRNKSNYLGFNDWRLPNLKELISIVETCGRDPSINQTVFPNTTFLGKSYWTSTLHSTNLSSAYRIFFGGGDIKSLGLNSDRKVRLVRGGRFDNSSPPIPLDAFDLFPLPEISITGNNNPIINGSTTPSITTNTDFGEVDLITGSKKLSFSIENAGPGSLILTGSAIVSITGTNSSNFTLTTPPATSIAIGTATTFEITFNPDGLGLRTAIITISNNDLDEDPYTFTVQGTSVNEAGIVISGGGTNVIPATLIVSGDTTPSLIDDTDFGSASVISGTVSHTFNLDSVGSADLILNSGAIPIVTISPAVDFIVEMDAQSPINVGNFTTFTIRFDPASSGTKIATVTVASNDPDTPSYTFDIQGVGFDTSEIAVFGQGILINPNSVTAPNIADDTAFPVLDIDTGSSIHTFTIKNTGTGALTLRDNPRITITGTNATDFSVSTDAPASIVALTGTATFDIEFNPIGTFTRSATIHISNDDTDEDPYEFRINGVGIANPDISVLGNGNLIAIAAIPNTTNNTDFGSLDIASATTVHNFTINNSGSGTLNITEPTITGADASDFTLTTSPTPSIITANNSNFSITFNPSASGARNAVVTIASNDPDENPYVFNIKGTGTATPEMTVLGNGFFIDDNDISPNIGDNTDFGNIDVGDNNSATFTISNIGSGNLDLTGTPRVIIAGTDAANFVLTVDAGTTLAPTTSSTFSIKFTPTFAGLHVATITIDNNDANENPYNFNIQGTGNTNPEIEIKGNNLVIDTGATFPQITDDTDFGEIDINDAVGNINIFTINNLGTGDLTLRGTPRITITGDQAADFQLTTDAPSSVTAAGTETFTLTFLPSGVGIRSAQISIANDDSNEDPYTFKIQGTGTATPEIAITGAGTLISTGDITPDVLDGTDFGSLDIGMGSNAHTFKITNTGSANLVLADNPRVTIAGTHASDFILTTDADATIAGTSTFTLLFDPSNVGTRSAVVTISNNDADEATYTFNIQGVGTATPEMNISGNGVIINDNDATPDLGDATNFGLVDAGSGTNVVFTINNTGSGVLNLTDSPKVSITGADAGSFTLTIDAAASIAALGSRTFTVSFNPSSAGVHSATLSVANNDSDENPYNFNIQGTGNTNPEISVESNGIIIDDGSITPNINNNTDFGTIELTDTTGKENTFNINNTGSGDLNLQGTPRIAITGDHASDFVLTVDAPNLITTAGTEIFKIKFLPSGIGVRTAQISIANDDNDEDPYEFTIQGIGNAIPEIAISGKGILIVDGDTSPDSTDGTDFGATDVSNGVSTQSFIITNTGSATLNLTANGQSVIITGANASDFSLFTDASDAIAANGGISIFTIRFNPSDVGIRVASVAIINNDSNENPYNFDIQGIGTTAPEITISGNNNVINDEDSTPEVINDTDFGTLNIGSSNSNIFTITNSGSIDLNLTNTPTVTISGTDANDFVLTTDAITPILLGGGNSTFEITFTPSHTGAHLATLSIANDDADENPYNFDLRGVGAAVLTMPTANSDTGSGFFGNAVTINVAGNDLDSAGINNTDLDLTSIKIIGATNVFGEGTWQANATGSITFTPIANFNASPAAIEYTIKDNASIESNVATVVINYTAAPVITPPVIQPPVVIQPPPTPEPSFSPVATADSVTAIQGEVVTILVTDNDSDQDGTIDINSISIGNQAIGESLTIAGQGIWSVGAGTITFTPDNDLTNSPSPIIYTVKDNEGKVSNAVLVIITYTPDPNAVITPDPITPDPVIPEPIDLPAKEEAIEKGIAFVENGLLSVPSVLTEQGFFAVTLREIANSNFWRFELGTFLGRENRETQVDFDVNTFDIFFHPLRRLNADDTFFEKETRFAFFFNDQDTESVYWREVIDGTIPQTRIALDGLPCNTQSPDIAIVNNNQIQVPAILLPDGFYSATLEAVSNDANANLLWRLENAQFLGKTGIANCTVLDADLNIGFAKIRINDNQGDFIELDNKQLNFMFFDQKTNRFYWQEQR